jgi:hypothetical protein
MHLYFTEPDETLLEKVKPVLNDLSRFKWNFSADPHERRWNLFSHLFDTHVARFGKEFFKGAWSVLHTAPVAMARAGAANAANVEIFLTEFIPEAMQCPACKTHYMQALDTDPPPVGDAPALFEWGVRLHNTVNARQYKTSLTLENAYGLYDMPTTA